MANQLLSAGPESFTYDDNGSMVTKTAPRGTTTLTYDAANRATQIADPGGNETSTYAPDGTRVAVNGPATEGRLMAVAYDTTGNPVLDYHVGWGLWIYRVYGPGIDEPLAEWRTYVNPNPRATYLHHDALGSVTMVSDNSSAVAYRTTYRAFGESTSTPNALGQPNSRLGYTSREIGPGSLMQYRSRWYDTGVGRFGERDEYSGAPGDPPSLHRYVYTLNSPANYSDPSGNFTVVQFAGWSILLAGVALFIGALYAFVEREWELAVLALAYSAPMIVIGSAFAFPGAPWSAGWQATTYALAGNSADRIALLFMACVAAGVARWFAVYNDRDPWVIRLLTVVAGGVCGVFLLEYMNQPPGPPGGGMPKPVQDPAPAIREAYGLAG